MRIRAGSPTCVQHKETCDVRQDKLDTTLPCIARCCSRGFGDAPPRGNHGTGPPRRQTTGTLLPRSGVCAPTRFPGRQAVRHGTPEDDAVEALAEGLIRTRLCRRPKSSAELLRNPGASAVVAASRAGSASDVPAGVGCCAERCSVAHVGYAQPCLGTEPGTLKFEIRVPHSTLTRSRCTRSTQARRPSRSALEWPVQATSRTRL
jgi:hypothetical protein